MVISTLHSPPGPTVLVGWGHTQPSCHNRICMIRHETQCIITMSCTPKWPPFWMWFSCHCRICLIPVQMVLHNCCDEELQVEIDRARKDRYVSTLCLCLLYWNVTDRKPVRKLLTRVGISVELSQCWYMYTTKKPSYCETKNWWTTFHTKRLFRSYKRCCKKICEVPWRCDKQFWRY